MKLIIIFLLLASANAFGDAKLPAQLSFCIGSVSTNYSETASKLVATDGTTGTTVTPYSGTASSMPIDVEFEYFSNLKKSYFLKGGGPVMASTPDRYFYFATGINFYFSPIGSPTYVSDERIEIKLAPKFRYYAGPNIGASYLIYNTKSQIKNDMIVELGLQGGAIYSINSKWGVKAEGAFSRGIGALLSSMTMKILLGTTYNLNF